MKTPTKTKAQKYQEFKHNMMRDIQMKGHSFPHWDTCSTCEDDFDEVFNAGWRKGRKEALVTRDAEELEFLESLKACGTCLIEHSCDCLNTNKHEKDCWVNFSCNEGVKDRITTLKARTKQ